MILAMTWIRLVILDYIIGKLGSKFKTFNLKSFLNSIYKFLLPFVRMNLTLAKNRFINIQTSKCKQKWEYTTSDSFKTFVKYLFLPKSYLKRRYKKCFNSYLVCALCLNIRSATINHFWRRFVHIFKSLSIIF